MSGDVDQVSLDTDKRQAIVNTVMNLRFPKKNEGNLLTS
jgi:hypothetical protein